MVADVNVNLLRDFDLCEAFPNVSIQVAVKLKCYGWLQQTKYQETPPPKQLPRLIKHVSGSL